MAPDPPPRESTERRTVYFDGRVQGVGFRYTTCQVARAHDVTGFVRNLPDGRVHLVAEGKTQEIDRFLGDLRRRMAHYIRGEQSSSDPAEGSFEGFDVR